MAVLFRVRVIFAPDPNGDNIKLTLTLGAIDSGLEMSLNEYVLDALKSTIKPSNFVEVKLPVVSTANGALAVISVTPVN